MALSSSSNFAVPNVQVGNITLESTADAPTWEDVIQKDPHVDAASLGEVTLPNIYHIQNSFSSKTSSLKLKVTLNLVFKDIISYGETSWFEIDDLLNAYKVVVVQSTNPVASSALLDKNFYHEAPKQFDTNPVYQDTYTQIKSIFEIADVISVKKLKEKLKTIMLDDGSISRELKTNVSFVVDTHNPKHLSYFLIPFIDLSALSGSETLSPFLEAATLDKNLIGKPWAEIIIEDYANTKLGMVLYDTNNNPYSGPSHWMPATSPSASGHWMMGEQHNDPFLPKKYADMKDKVLKAVTVANIKIQDFRSMNKIDKINLNFTPVENRMFNMNENPQNITPPVKKHAIFTDIKLSRDSTNQARYFFGMNYYQLIKNNSALPALYDMANLEMVDRFLANSTIHSMKIKRRRVEETRCENQVLDSGCLTDYKEFDDHNEFGMEILAHTAEIRTNLKKKNYFRGSGRYAVDTGKRGSTRGSKKMKAMGSLQEVKIKLQESNFNTSNLRHFTGIDYAITEITDGLYQYGIEIELEDGADIVMRQLVITADKALVGLREILNDLHRFGNPNFNNFSKMLENIDSTKLSEYTEHHDAGMKSVEEILKLFTKKPNIDDLISVLYTASHPEIGSPAGFETLVKILNNLREKVVSLIRSTSNSKSYKSSSKKNPFDSEIVKTKRRDKRFVKIEYYFSNVFNADVDNRAGYEFLSLANSPFANEAGASSAYGLLSLSTGQFNSRVTSELRKVFSDDAIAASGQQNIDVNPKYTSDDTLDASKYKYLAPSHILLPSLDKPFELLADNKSFLFDHMKNANILSDIITYNRRGESLQNSEIVTNADLENLTEDAQRLKKKLKNALFAKSCTVENAVSAFESLLLQGVSGKLSPQLGDELPPAVPQIYGINPNLAYESNKIIAPIDNLADSYELGLNKDFLDSTNPNSLLLTLLNINLYGAHDKKSSLNWYDLYGSNNFIKEYFNHRDGDARKISTAIKSAPNQIKFWLLIAAKFSTGGTNDTSNLIKYGWPDKDIMKDQKWQPSIWMHFKNLMQIQVLTSYTATELEPKQPISMKGENWKPLAIEDLGSPGNYLCRMVPYEKTTFNIKRHPELELPIYHEYFIIRNRTTAMPAEETVAADVHTSSTVENLRIAMKKSRARYVSPEDMQTATLGGTAGSNAAKKYIFTELKQLTRGNQPLGPLGVKLSTTKTKIENLIGRSISFIQQATKKKTLKKGKFGGKY